MKETKCFFADKDFCEEKILKEIDIPDTHHINGNHNDNRPENRALCHHKCHMIYHGIYPKNYNELRQLVEAKNTFQKMRISFVNQVTSLNRLGFEEDDKQKEIIKSIKYEEQRIVKEYKKIVKELPLWKEWLSKIHGVGEDFSGQIIAILGDISRFERISNLNSYCGYGLYDNTIQGLKTGQKHNYNHNFRSTLYAIATNGFIMHKEKSLYGKLYDQYKEEYRREYPEPIPNPKYNGKTGHKMLYTDIHIHLMSIRKMMKDFIKDLWLVWRIIEDLPISDPYEVAFLGHERHAIPYFDIEEYMKRKKKQQIPEDLDWNV